MIGPGQTLEKYEVLEKVGEGGMATVYRGRHSTLGREVAIKVMHPHLASSDRNRTRFEREARAIETLRHPNILKIFDYSGSRSDQCFIITEFIRGGTLRTLLEDVGAMMPEPAALLAYELCNALEAAHVQGIIHRDVKPENVMLTADAGVKLMDFGIARILADAQVTMTGALVGSPAYMSPEQATDGQVTEASDLFALGTMLYRMVTGTLPFRGGNPSIVIKAIIDGIYDSPADRVPSLSPAVCDIITRCLSRDLAVRYESAAAVRKDLGEALLKVGIDPEDPGPWSLAEYVRDPEAYEDRLRAHLLITLVDRGRTEAEAGQTSQALRTFNRVLALDEDNSEVVEIIEGMRRPLLDEGKSSARVTAWLGAVAALILLVLGGLWWTGALGVGIGGVTEPLARLAMVAPAPIPIPDEVPDPQSTPTVEAATEEDPTPPEKPSVDSVQIEDAPRPLPTPAIAPPEATPTPPPAPTPGADDPGGEGAVALVAEDAPPESCEGTASLHVGGDSGYREVFVDGEKLNGYGGAPARSWDIPAGRHTVELRNPAHRPQRVTAWICPDRPLDIEAKADYLDGAVRFFGFPAGAVAYVNDRPRGVVSDGVPLNLPFGGPYVVQVRQDGKVLDSRVVRVSTQPDDLLPGKFLEVRDKAAD